MKLKHLIICTIIVLFLGHNPFIYPKTVEASVAEATKEEESFFIAKKALEDGFYDVALGLLERFLSNYSQSPNRWEAELLVGQCYFFQNKFLPALAKFESILKEKNAKHIEDACLYWIAEVHFRGNDFKAAYVYYKRIIDEYPESSYRMHAYYSSGWALFELKDYLRAIEYLKVVQKDYSDQQLASDAAFKIAECYYNLKNYDKLKDFLSSYQKNFPKDTQRLPLVYFYIAEADYYLNDFQSAIEQYKNVLDSAKDDKIKSLSQLGIIWSYLKLNKYKDAESLIAGINESSLEKQNFEIFALAKGVLFNQTERFEEALKIYDKLINSQPQESTLVQGFIGKAETLYNLSRFKDAIIAYQEAFDKIDSDETSSDLIDKLHYGCGWAFLKEGQFKEAISEFQRVATKSSDKIVKIAALCLVADTYVDLGEFEKAIESYDLILKGYPDSLYSDYVQYQIGITLLKMSNYDGAILAFKVLLKNFPKSKLLDDAFYSLALTYFQKEDYVTSEQLFRQFSEQFRDNYLRKDAMYLLGTSLYNLEKFPEAIDIFKEIIGVYSADLQIVQQSEYEIADCLYRMGKVEEAVSKFNSLRSKYPDSSLTAEVVWWLGEYYYRQEKFNLARRYFLSIIKDFPKSNLLADAFYALGSTYEQEGDYKKANDNFKKVIEIGDRDLAGQACVAIADMFVEQEKYELALKTFQEIINEYPNLTVLLYPKMADVYNKSGNYDEAIKLYRKSLEIAPLRQMSSLQFQIADLLQQQGKIDGAVQEYLKLTYLYPEDQALLIKSLLRVGQIYEDKENYKEAKNIYNKVIQMSVEEAKYARERVEWIEKNINIR